MKKLLISALALGLAAAMPSALWAAPDDHHDSAGSKGGQRDTGSKGNSGPKMGTDRNGSGSGNGGNGGKNGGADKGKFGTTHRSHHTATSKTSTARTTLHFKADITTYKRTFQARHQFHAGIYRAPHGYTYRRWGIGERLTSEYYVSDFWLNDFADYDLATPPDGYVWVRYGPDAILIDESDGEVIQVAYGVFD